MRHDIYRAACEEAASEQRQILAKEEQLRLRRQLIEKAMQALEPFSGTQADAVAAFHPVIPAPTEMLVFEPAAEPVPFQVQQATAMLAMAQDDMNASSDPFESRINSVLSGWKQAPSPLLKAS